MAMGEIDGAGGAAPPAVIVYADVGMSRLGPSAYPGEPVAVIAPLPV